MKRLKKKQQQKPISVVKSPSQNKRVKNRAHQKQNIINELDLIKARVNQILQNYEAESEIGPSSYTDTEVSYVKNLIAKCEENQQEKKETFNSINNFYGMQLEKLKEIDTEYSINEPPPELLKDIQHHEFRNAYDVTLKAMDELKSIMSSAAKLSKASKSDAAQAATADTGKCDKSKNSEFSSSMVTLKGGAHDIRGPASFPLNSSLKSDYTNAYLKQSKLETIASAQEKELKLIKAAYNELFSENQKSVDTASEVNKLTKELNQVHKEVEMLQRNLEAQQKMLGKQRKVSVMSTGYSDRSFNNEDTPNITESMQRNSLKQQKTLTKDRKMLTTTTQGSSNYNEEVLAASQNSFSSNSSHYSSITFDDDLSSKQEVKFDSHRTAGIDNRCNKNRSKRNIPPINSTKKSQTVPHPRGEHKNIQVGISRQHKAESSGSNTKYHKPNDPVKLPDINMRPGNNHNLSKGELSTVKNTSDYSQASKEANQQSSFREIIAKTLLDLHNNEQLTVNQIKDQKDVLNTLITKPVYDLTKVEQLDKAAQVTVEYVNMSQLINKVGQILKDHCEQDDKAYQSDIVQTEEESQNNITKHYSSFMQNMITAVDSVNEELRRDGIFSDESFSQILKTYWLNPDCFPVQNKHSKDLDFITKFSNALETINNKCQSHMQQMKSTLVEKQRRISALRNANPKIYQKCMKQLKNVLQLPNVIDKSLEKGTQQISNMLVKHRVKIQSSIKTFNHNRELLVTETKSKIQSYISEIIEIIDRISSLCAKNNRKGLMTARLQNLVKQLSKLCISTQIVRECNTKGENTIDKKESFSEHLKSVLKEMQDQVKDIISNKLGVHMPNQFDFEVVGKSVYKTELFLPCLSNICIQDIMDQQLSDHESHHSGLLNVSYDGQRPNQFHTHQHNSTWDPLMDHFLLLSKDELSDLAKGITRFTIGKRINDDRPTTSSIEYTQNVTKGRLPRLHTNDHGTRYHNSHNDTKITRKNRFNSKGGPLECLKVTSLTKK